MIPMIPQQASFTCHTKTNVNATSKVEGCYMGTIIAREYLNGCLQVREKLFVEKILISLTLPTSYSPKEKKKKKHCLPHV